MVRTVVVLAEVTSGSNKVMRATRFKPFADPSVLELTEVAAWAVDERVVAASINSSVVNNVGETMKETTLPRIPSRDFAGVVEVGPADWGEATVWATGGDAGFTRDPRLRLCTFLR
jgi:NADPH:quinone reductase